MVKKITYRIVHPSDFLQRRTVLIESDNSVESETEKQLFHHQQPFGIPQYPTRN